MMKRLLSAAVLVFVLSLCAVAQDVCQRHVEPLGGYSLCVPQGWSIEEKEGQSFKSIFAPRAEKFTPNLNVKEDTNAAPLADYAAASIKYVLAHYEEIGATSLKLIEQSNFRTTSGLSSVRATFSTEFKGLTIRTLQYYFSGKNNQKLIVTATFLEESKASLDPVFDRALKSFQLDK
ncbi:MAG: hypothetical protein QOF02_1167 [Blastocatellia bacterium]|jgi:hypothetical protein|nr:hypothetical protein [Blastocatellia bacterium]